MLSWNRHKRLVRLRKFLESSSLADSFMVEATRMLKQKYDFQLYQVKEDLEENV
jgi:hypothetical protein